jgi:hypothetical protein
MASWAELRERQLVKVALYKGEPVPSEDNAMVCEVLDGLRWNRPLALVWAVLFCVWSSRLQMWTLLRQYKRILNGADKLGFRRAG